MDPDRIGPTASTWGLWAGSMADGVKLLLTEIILRTKANKALLWSRR